VENLCKERASPVDDLSQTIFFRAARLKSDAYASSRCSFVRRFACVRHLDR